MNHSQRPGWSPCLLGQASKKSQILEGEGRCMGEARGGGGLDQEDQVVVHYKEPPAGRLVNVMLNRRILPLQL